MIIAAKEINIKSIKSVLIDYHDYALNEFDT